MKRNPPEIIRIRKKLCLEMAENMLDQIAYKHERDVDRIALLIETSLPLHVDEAIAYWEDMKAHECAPLSPAKPSLLDRLAKALGLEREKLSLSALMLAAIERIEAAKGASK